MHEIPAFAGMTKQTNRLACKLRHGFECGDPVISMGSGLPRGSYGGQARIRGSDGLGTFYGSIKDGVRRIGETWGQEGYHGRRLVP